MILLTAASALAQSGPQDEPPPQRYLTTENIRQTLLTPDWQGCVPEGAEDLTAPVSFRILPSGSVETVSVDASTSIQGCWSDLISVLQFGAHDEEPLLIRWTLGIHSGQAIPYPAFEAEGRQIYPFFLFIPPDVPPGSVEALLEVLEVPEARADP